MVNAKIIIFSRRISFFVRYCTPATNNGDEEEGRLLPPDNHVPLITSKDE